MYKPIAETNNFIVLENYTKYSALHEPDVAYQSESDLEQEFIQDLVNQGYELANITNHTSLMLNLRVQIEALNEITFTESEWQRFLNEYLDKPSDTLVDKTEKIHNNHKYDFTFDNGHLQNIYLVNKEQISRNKLQVISQFEQTGGQLNRYDVTILVNGLPLVQIELKKRGVAIKEAFNQIHRYTKESFNAENSLFKYLQLFVISNGTDSRYFANTVKRDKHSYDFTMNWARANNKPIKDLKDFTATFFQKQTLLSVLLTYSVFDTSNTLLVMRPYQIAATERILWKIKSAYESKKWATTEGGGFIWHTTGSGKTLTSFKVARLATQLSFIDKVFFVVDRKDLDTQTLREYRRFSPDSVNGSPNTAGLRRNIEKDDNKIIITTIQKLNNLIKSENNLDVYQKQVVFIFDEAHRSQFGEAQQNIRRKFKKYYQFGFTGTPIFPENALGSETTASVFGRELHSYVITDAIRDEKVLKFKVDYNNVRAKFKEVEGLEDDKQITASENRKALLHPERIKEISSYILEHYRTKTHRNLGSNTGFNAMFAVSSVEAAKLYYETLNELQKDSDKPLKIATIYSFAANEEQNAIGDIADENFEPTAMNISAKEFLSKAIDDYNLMFGQSYNVNSNEFQNYYQDLAQKVRDREVDLLIVVGMFLTGFDAPTLNTLFVDKNLKYHGLIQAYSRTNRIFNATKTFGNIITFRDLEKSTIDAITLFGDANTQNIILEKSYKEYLEGFTDIITGEAKRGFKEVVKELNSKFPNPDNITLEKDKKEFAKLFGEYLRIENVLQNFDEYTALKELQHIDISNKEDLEKFKAIHHVNDTEIAEMLKMEIINERSAQDYRSTYNDIREWLRTQRKGKEAEESTISWDDIVFEVDLLKSQEINLDYIIGLILDNKDEGKDKEELIAEIRRVIRASIGNRAKESLVVEFINETDLNDIKDKVTIIEEFFKFAQRKQKIEAELLIKEENLTEDAAKRYITSSLKREYASDEGTELNELLPRMSPLNPQYLIKKQTVFQKIAAFVEKFKGVGGEV